MNATRTKRQIEFNCNLSSGEDLVRVWERITICFSVRNIIPRNVKLLIKVMYYSAEKKISIKVQIEDENTELQPVFLKAKLMF